jgi:hypothetical protein
MKTFTNRKRKFLRNIFKGLSATSAAFIFQACYGIPQDFGFDVLVTGLVTSNQTGEPVPGIKVSIDNQPQYKLTCDNGRFAMYASQDSVYTIRFEDADSLQNGAFMPKDTIVEVTGGCIDLNIGLDVR